MEDYDLSETPCPKCGHEPTHWRDCIELMCENGLIDVSEEFYEIEGTSFETCTECNGAGHLHWCPKCGHEIN